MFIALIILFTNKKKHIKINFFRRDAILLMSIEVGYDFI